MQKLPSIVQANKLIKEGKEIAVLAGQDVIYVTQKQLEFANETKLTKANIREMFIQWCGLDTRYGYKYFN